jgi:hypothetical protein
MREHHNKAKLPLSDDYASAIGQHARTTDHHFRQKNITYLAREGNKMARGIKEAIFTRALDPLSTGEVACATSSHMHMTTSSPPPYVYRNHLRLVLRALLSPSSTSTTPDPRAAYQDPATASCASPSSMLPSPRLRPPRVLRKPRIPPQQPHAAPVAPARTPPP